MRLADHTVLVVGGTSGIGQGLAHRFRDAGSTVVVGGRNAQPGNDLDAVRVDVTDPDSVRRARDEVLHAHPDLDVVVTMSGVMLVEDLRDPAHIAAAETTIATNLLGTIRVVDAFTPHLVARGAGTVVTVSSGIAFLPFPPMPSYGAAKAGVHAYTEALRAQLAGTGVDVTELVPPAVATAGQEQVNPAALPLTAYLDEVVALLATEPTPHELLVDGVLGHRWAERDGTYADLVRQRSRALAMLPGR
ncbi:Short-chain dehydrogenase involved in D-alanine esterification of teichoic acids [Jatrophihabitans endophyticus]|uniref:Short-chain dehydrogenase involved in D-alanine esterification of teichoic acids n=1 Tax=Jatrophihabitans endophyticus TaxID=1206085 RepID=A0A1M5E034_9ACTN|nr:SDR family NAD(P)-dependent oxidoreductase [Jatrophihabitans endophyticus]SHF72618.1 Short-chain dehydrogenase involved in D-alanine esterification of teichoic acids [Jatrophihabitans endophyticus]